MSGEERRQYCRIDDYVYFDFRIMQAGDCCSDLGIRNELLGESGQKYLETLQYFQSIDYELAGLNKSFKEPAIERFLHLLNAKIDFLSRQMMIPPNVKRQKVNISLGGLAFKTSLGIQEGSRLKVIIYTKPKMLPILVDATVVYSQNQNDLQFRTAVAFKELTTEQEQLLSQHILLAQVKCPADYT